MQVQKDEGRFCRLPAFCILHFCLYPMLTKRIIPCLDVDRGRVVKGVKFFDHVDAGDPVEQAKRYQDDGADELVFYDITASHEGREIMADLVSQVVEQIFMPLTSAAASARSTTRRG